MKQEADEANDVISSSCAHNNFNNNAHATTKCQMNSERTIAPVERAESGGMRRTQFPYVVRRVSTTKNNPNRERKKTQHRKVWKGRKVKKNLKMKGKKCTHEMVESAAAASAVVDLSSALTFICSRFVCVLFTLLFCIIAYIFRSQLSTLVCATLFCSHFPFCIRNNRFCPHSSGAVCVCVCVLFLAWRAHSAHTTYVYQTNSSKAHFM